MAGVVFTDIGLLINCASYAMISGGESVEQIDPPPRSDRLIVCGRAALVLLNLAFART